MVLIHMGYLKPMSVTDCTPNSLWKNVDDVEKHIIKEEEKENEEENEVLEETYAETSSEEDN